jgi:hypothetical protein
VGLRGTQGADGIGTFPCPKIDSGGERCNDGVVRCCRTKERCPPSVDNELSICEDTVHCSYSSRPLLFTKSCKELLKYIKYYFKFKLLEMVLN